MRAILARNVLGGVLLLAACGDMPQVSETNGAVFGTPTGTHLEVGYLTNRLGSCTATLVAQRWVLTAAHCIGFSNQADGTFMVGNGTGPDIYPVQEVFNLGPPGPISGDPSSWTFSHVREAADTSGSDDLALLLLRDRVNLSIIPAAIEHTIPDPGSTVSVIGYGSGQKATASWSFALNTDGRSYRSVIDANGAIYKADIVGYDLSTGGPTQSGDSGGPAIKGDVFSSNPLNPLRIWGVVSGGTVISTAFGAAAYLNKLICDAAYNREPHGLCVTGAPLIKAPTGCIWTDVGHVPTDQELREKVIHATCTKDTYCCNPVGAWDGICVGEADFFRQALGVQCQ